MGTAPTTGAGTYKIVVSGYSGLGTPCYDDPQATWAYHLSVEGGTGLALMTADAPGTATHTVTTSVVGSGTAVAAP